MSKSKEGIFSRIIIALSISVIIIYTAVITVNFLVSGNEPSTTTVSVYAFFGSELGFLAAKRIICGKKAAAGHQTEGYGNGSFPGSYGSSVFENYGGGDERFPDDG